MKISDKSQRIVADVLTQFMFTRTMDEVMEVWKQVFEQYGLCDMSIAELLKADEEKILKIVSDYPVQVPVPVVAEILGCSPENVRQAIDEGKLGLSWKKPGRVNHGYCVPTIHFVRWYLRING